MFVRPSRGQRQPAGSHRKQRIVLTTSTDPFRLSEAFFFFLPGAVKMIRNEEGKGEKIQTHLLGLVGFRASPDHHRSPVARDANRNAQDESSKGQRKSPCVQPSRTRSESTGQWRHRRFRGDRIACVHDGATPWARLCLLQASAPQFSKAPSQQP